jgi:hypothetical protein
MEAAGTDRRDLVRAIYRQHCAHARSIENRRLWFFSVFVLLCAAVFTVLRGQLLDAASWPAVAFLASLSLFGLLLCLRMQSELDAHVAAAELILSRYSLKHYSSLAGTIAPQRLTWMPKMYPLFFLLVFCFLLFALLRMVFCGIWTSSVIPLVVFAAGAVIVLRGNSALSLKQDDR